ncbi:sensor domain-containing diguanylate cyclase [Vibrio algarum]|uniref:diguanylate cyclase n=1 Tax=Vibrio algarum TaxID=3020714 RepID=A0ABT4YTD1_9VIBR|nr:GGDEF domain-containing protein [Vibrio sp. KJ40-1]MDB1124788.1 GGDEF domain-containing protein [Vibrio sp. KJ40-1]
MDSNDRLKERYYKVLDSLPDHVFIFSESGIYIDVYGGEENATGFDCKPFIGHSLNDVAPPEMAAQFLSYITKALAENATQVVKYHFANQNMIKLPAEVMPPEELWFEGTIKPLPITENGERTVVWMARNITQRYYLEKQLKKLSETDEMTGVSNRRAFMSYLAKELKKFRRYHVDVSFLMLDIDRFKAINDQLGHQSGDEVIKHVAKLCQLEVREVDYLGRIGGEEFAIILAHTGEDKALEIAERIRESISSASCEVEDYSVNVTVSIGVSQMRTTDDSIKFVLSRADKAMYHSKVTGRNKVTVYSRGLKNSKVNLTSENRIVLRSS